jgi:SAM-dependent methyltransferase
MSEAAKILPKIEKYLGSDKRILDIACGDEKIVPHAIGVDGRNLSSVDVVSIDLDYVPRLLDDIGKFLYKDPKFQYNPTKKDGLLSDVVFSSHYLEHCADQYKQMYVWSSILRKGGLLILYLPDGRYYNNHENLEHMIDMNYDQFMFWFRRVWCGEGKDFKGDHIGKDFELIEHGMDIGPDRYSFYVIARKV